MQCCVVLVQCQCAGADAWLAGAHMPAVWRVSPALACTTHPHLCACTHTQACMHTHTLMLTCMRSHLHLRTRTSAHMHTCVCTHAPCMHTPSLLHMHACMHPHLLTYVCAWVASMPQWPHTHARTAHAHARTHARMHARTGTHACALRPIHIYSCGMCPQWEGSTASKTAATLGQLARRHHQQVSQHCTAPPASYHTSHVDSQ